MIYVMSARVVLLLPRFTYRNDFLDAAEALGIEVIVGADFRQAMAEQMGDRALHLDFGNPEQAAAAIASLHARRKIDAVVAADEQGVLVAAVASARLGLRHNSIAAASFTRDKLALRQRLATAGVSQPLFATSDWAATPAGVGFDPPFVVKPRRLSGSQGVLRIDNFSDLAQAVTRVQRIACHEEPVLIESFVPGVEIAVEGLVRGGGLEVLATFDKPDPLNGPTFEETLYVTPSRMAPDVLEHAHALVAEAARALALVEGPVHAEVRIDRATGRQWVIEVAGRSIGGLCSRTLRFGLDVRLEELILRHALGLRLPPLRRERTAAGVLMLPVPKAGILKAVHGIEAARAVAGIKGIEITVTNGTGLTPLPEGDRYLGFVFARAATPEIVEGALRSAWSLLRIQID